ncbi:MAG: ABC transporter permease subunit, partial [bacterium]|nr:ABC transporter permease subunit [bacterium]
MLSYILRRILLMFPTLFGVMLINFAIIQFVPGGPVEQMIAVLQGVDTDATSRISGGGSEVVGSTRGNAGGGNASAYRGAQGLDPDLIADLQRTYGFDKPAHERFLKMAWNYLRFDFGDSFFRDQSVFDIVLSKMPVSISLGLWTTLLVYMISIPLGIAKAVRDGSKMDVWSSGVIVIGNAVPGFMFAIFLIVLFAGGSYFDWFPLRGLTSPNWDQLGLLSKIFDYFWHLVLPVAAMVIGGFAGLTLLTKNSFLDEINKQYVLTARSKGLEERR